MSTPGHWRWPGSNNRYFPVSRCLF
ncbi:BcpO-related WXXGXW repeat protein [Salmonella enterica subsp. enterica]|nr:hypothetical protein [Salmonella enterica]EDT7188196.1 BcpO-related WXXGXW repeat protein [Salmonella enterica subsp. enterica]EBE9925443.1 hypothetical protein [Salmonella enterica]ECL7697744.1 hypothetical protein [Salmonella enterica]EDV0528957.1 BcpO-related WXXGXW repeat protein [Salmonella enterica subsp. enterica]